MANPWQAGTVVTEVGTEVLNLWEKEQLINGILSKHGVFGILPPGFGKCPIGGFF